MNDTRKKRIIIFTSHNFQQIVRIFNILFGNFNQNIFVTRAVHKKMVNKMK